MSSLWLSRFLRIAIGGTDQFRYNFVRLASANVLAQVIAVLALPALTRLYSPQDFGVLAVYTTAQSLILSVATGRFEWSIPNLHRPSEVAQLLGLGLIATALTTTAVALALVGFLTPIANQLGIPPAAWPLIWLLPLGVAAGGAQLILESWHVFRRDMSPVGLAKMVQAVITVLLSTIAGFLSAGASGLVIGYVVGFVLAAPVLLYNQRSLSRLLCALRPARVRAALVVYGRRALTSVAVSMVNVSMALSMLLLLTLHYSVATVGWYGLVFRVATAPINLLSTAIAHSFWADAAALAKTDPSRLRSFYLQSVGRLAILAAPLAVVFLAGPLYIGPLFGRAQWSEAGWLLAAVTPYLVGIVIFGPTTHLIVYGRQGWQFACDLGTLVAAAVSFSGIAVSGFDAPLAVLAASCVLFAGYVVRFLLHLRASSLLIAQYERRSAP